MATLPMRGFGPRPRRPLGGVGACVGGVALCALAFFACPSGIQPPPVGPDCVTTADCNVGRGCGDLRPCVIGRCIPDASIVVPCDGYDTPVGDVVDAGES